MCIVSQSAPSKLSSWGGSNIDNDGNDDDVIRLPVKASSSGIDKHLFAPLPPPLLPPAHPSQSPVSFPSQ